MKSSKFYPEPGDVGQFSFQLPRILSPQRRPQAAPSRIQEETCEVVLKSQGAQLISVSGVPCSKADAALQAITPNTRLQYEFINYKAGKAFTWTGWTNRESLSRAVGILRG